MVIAVVDKSDHCMFCPGKCGHGSRSSCKSQLRCIAIIDIEWRWNYSIRCGQSRDIDGFPLRFLLSNEPRKKLETPGITSLIPMTVWKANMGFKWIVSSQLAAYRAAPPIYQHASNGKKLELDGDWMTYRGFRRGLDWKRCNEIDGNP